MGRPPINTYQVNLIQALPDDAEAGDYLNAKRKIVSVSGATWDEAKQTIAGLGTDWLIEDFKITRSAN